MTNQSISITTNHLIAAQAYIKILPTHRDVKPIYRAEDSGNYVTILALECRGLEPIKW
ncbi:DUF866 domain-containing protein [archaeon]|nr:MAG: DUF866 domain-containing protein [archaeon]